MIQKKEEGSVDPMVKVAKKSRKCRNFGGHLCSIHVENKPYYMDWSPP